VTLMEDLGVAAVYGGASAIVMFGGTSDPAFSNPRSLRNDLW
jgi:hypothetical protein